MNLSYAYLSINIISLAFIIAAIAAVINGRHKSNSRELLFVLVFIFIGSLSIFAESAVSGYENKLLWRNLSQIGLFLLPSASFNFVMVYTKTKSRSLNIIRRVNFIYASLCVILIFTNDFHHIMRITVDLAQSDVGLVLKVRQTTIGKICVAVNTLISLTSLIRLWVFMRTTARNYRPQVRLIFTGFLIPIVFTYARSAILTSLGILIPTPLSFLLGILFILWGMYRYDLLSLSPIARDWVIDEINIGMIFTRPDGEIADVNRYLLEHFDNRLEGVRSFVGADRLWSDALANHENKRLEVRWSRGDEQKIFAVNVHDLRKRKRSLGTVSLLTDVTAERDLQKSLLARAETDSMTKILNREAFEHKVTEIIQLHRGSDMLCSLFIFDIDNFKQINDTWGHIKGDEVIKEVVSIINSTSRQNDYVGRLGGDEFVMFLFDTDAASSARIAGRINTSVSRSRIDSEGRLIEVSLSIGITNTPINDISYSLLYARADEALFKAKEGGRNRYCFYED